MNKPPNVTYEMIDIDRLDVDPRYQCKPRSRSVRIISTGFDFALFGTPEVSARPDGRYVILDGQTRVKTSKALGKLPPRIMCRVHHELDLPEEARLFVAMNGNRSPVPAVAKYVADVVARTPAAMDINRITSNLGLSVTGYRTTTSLTSVSALYSLLTAGVLERVLRIAKQWANDSTRPEAFDGRILRGIWHFLSSETVVDSVLCERLSSQDPRQVMRNIDTEKTLRSTNVNAASVLVFRKIYHPGKKSGLKAV